MRNYSVVSPAFWTGKTGKAIKAAGTDAQVLALYLLTSPHSNMIGMYFLPKLYISYETGLTEQGALEGLQSLSKIGFCDYDEAAEVVWVYEMARFQIGSSITESDNRVKSVRKEFENTPKCKFLDGFQKKYGGSFHLKKGPSKPLPTEQSSSGPEQDQEQKDIGQQADRFNDFWIAYPRRVKKKPTAKIWQSKKLDRLADEIIQDITRRLSSDRRWLDGFIPDPTTYLNQERWNDDIDTSPPTAKPDWAKIPSDDGKLWAWAKQHGYSNPGNLDYFQYRRKLQNEVEVRMNQ